MEDLNTLWPETSDNPAGIYFTSHEVSFTLQNAEDIKAWILETISLEGYSLHRLDFVFCTDSFLLEMNRQHLNHDYFTDIITFPLADDPIEAEVYISLDRVKDNAKSFGTAFERELHRVIIHGVLHLCGYDDYENTDIEMMRDKEQACLERLLKD